MFEEATDVAAAGQEQRLSIHVVPYTPQMAEVVGVASLNTGSDATGADVIVVSEVGKGCLRIVLACARYHG